MSALGYSNYVESHFERLGKLPSHWDVVALKRVATLTYGDALATDIRAEGGQISVFGSNGPVGLHDEPNTEAPVIFIGRKGSCGALNWSDVAGFAIDTVYFVDRRTSRVSLRWLYWLLHTLGLEHSSQDTGVPGLARETAHAARVPWPPPSEQAAIAAFLDRETGKIDALVEAQRRLIELLKEKRQAVIAHAVTKGLDPAAPMKESGVEWLGEVPAHWRVTALKRSWAVTDCKHVTAEFVDDGVPLASIREVQSRFVDLRTAKRTTEAFYFSMIEGGRRPEAGDLIFSRNATVGEVAEVSALLPPFAMGQDVCLLRKEDVRASSAYLYHVIRSRIVQDQLALAMIGSTFKRVNVEEIRDLVIPTPPPPEQQAIADFVAERAGSVDALIDQAEAAIALLHERRSALISAAVTGKIDVRGLVTEQAEAA